jgi:hypothetical protein
MTLGDVSLAFVQLVVQTVDIRSDRGYAEQRAPKSVALTRLRRGNTEPLQLRKNRFHGRPLVGKRTYVPQQYVQLQSTQVHEAFLRSVRVRRSGGGTCAVPPPEQISMQCHSPTHHCHQ